MGHGELAQLLQHVPYDVADRLGLPRVDVVDAAPLETVSVTPSSTIIVRDDPDIHGVVWLIGPGTSSDFADIIGTAMYSNLADEPRAPPLRQVVFSVAGATPAPRAPGESVRECVHLMSPPC